MKKFVDLTYQAKEVPRTKEDLSRWSVAIACENIRFSSLFAARDISHGEMSATQRQKFHTDDTESVRNPVRSADWSTEKLHCFSNCLQMTDKRPQRSNVNAKNL